MGEIGDVPYGTALSLHNVTCSPPPVLERKRPVGSQVFVASSQGAASGFESEKCRQMKRGDKAVFGCLHAPLLRQGKPKQ